MNDFLDSIGVSQIHQKKLEKTGLCSMHALLYYFPRQYKIYGPLQNTLEKHYVCFMGKVIKIKTDKKYSMATVITPQGIRTNIFWFRNKYMQYHLPYFEKQTVYVCGQAEYSQQHHSYTIKPDIFSQNPKDIIPIMPVYKEVLKTDSSTIHRYIMNAMEKYPDEQETIPQDIIQKYSITDRQHAFRYIHDPHTPQEIIEAQKYFTIEMLYRYAEEMYEYNSQFSKDTKIDIRQTAQTEEIIRNLPFKLTESQNRLVQDFHKQMSEKKRIQALVQGNVSCGKTIIAQLAMLMTAENGYQAVMIAPTTILAEQHYLKIQELIRNHESFHCVLVTGDTKTSEKKKRNKDIKEGKYNLIIGTTALLSESVTFHNLGMLVTDEEHRFGVEQKELLAKGVHMIQMSATPIPRSLAQVMYSNGIQVESITDMPPGRLPVSTYVSDRQTTCSWIEYQRQQGYKVYIICPQIESENDSEHMSVEEAYKIYSSLLSSPGKIGCATGKMTAKEVQENIRDFRNGKYDVLISTTVVEVGVDVPDATIIVIEDANLFGISQLHQLRGRVGRSNIQSYCFLIPGKNITEDGQKRMETLCRTNDGLEIARADMELRGMGDIIGTKQSGKDERLLLAIRYPETFRTIYEKVAGN